MRALYMEEYNGLISATVTEIYDMGYDDDITCIKDDNGKYNILKDRPIEGLYMKDIKKNYYYFPNLSQSTCEKICEEALQKGFVDLRKYGPYMDYPDESEE